MSGYTPVFSSVFTGTLHGKWPDVGLWLCLLGMADRHGQIDCTPQYIASVTGLELSQVEECIARFMDADKYSRTQSDDGRRLVLIDADRPWGWKIVNHGKYREKARLQSRDKERTESGRDAARKSAERIVPRSPPKSPADPLSDSDSDSDKDIRVKNGRKRPSKHALPDDFRMTPELSAYVTTTIPDASPDGLFAKFTDQAKAAGWTYADWSRAFQTYVRNAAPGSGHFAAGQYPKKQAAGFEGVKWQ